MSQNQQPYLSVNNLLDYIDHPYREACKQILLDNWTLFTTVQGSKHNHQAWLGGYSDHIQEVMNIACQMYKTMASLRPPPFSLSDGLLILFLHDIEKPWKYEIEPKTSLLTEISSLKNKKAQHEFRAKKLQEYGISLTEEQQNAMRYVEGELSDYSGYERTMNPLAAFCHVCDVLSARLWFNYPLDTHDPWQGACRLKN